MRKVISISLLMLLGLSVNQHVRAQEEKYIGLFVYNFTKYFDWPENSKSGDFVIQVIGNKSVYDELVRLTRGKKVGSQDLVIKNVTNPLTIEKSQIIFVGHWQSRHLPTVLNRIGNHPTLIITEMEGLLEQGSAINFIIREGSIKFELKTSNVQKHQLKTDPRIRELAYKVVD